jgi:hypothetical protein
MISGGQALIDFGVLKQLKGTFEEIDGRVFIESVVFYFSENYEVKIDLVEETCELNVQSGLSASQGLSNLDIAIDNYLGLVIEELWVMENSWGCTDGITLKFRDGTPKGVPLYVMLEARPGEIDVKLWS